MESNAIETDCAGEGSKAACYRRKLVRSYCDNQPSGNPYEVAEDIAVALEKMKHKRQAEKLRQLQFGKWVAKDNSLLGRPIGWFKSRHIGTVCLGVGKERFVESRFSMVMYHGMIMLRWDMNNSECDSTTDRSRGRGTVEWERDKQASGADVTPAKQSLSGNINIIVSLHLTISPNPLLLHRANCLATSSTKGDYYWG